MPTSDRRRVPDTRAARATLNRTRRRLQSGASTWCIWTLVPLMSAISTKVNLCLCIYQENGRCTLTNKAVGTIWRALSKPPQRRQGPDPRPLWLLVGTPSAFGPELAYRLRVAQPTLMDVTRYFWYTFILLYMFVTSPLWLAVGPQSS